jgi:saccharopine dehydrogenase-like NADP-dependent oxidoreductase
MRDILIVGAGKIGTVIADLLASSGDYALTVADRDPVAVERVGAELPGVRAVVLDIGDPDALAAMLEGRWAVVDAGPFDIGARIASAAVI